MKRAGALNYWYWRVPVAAALLAVAPALFAQDAPSDGRLPLGADKIEIEGGYKADYVAGRKSEGWYRATYKGKPVAMRGTELPFTDTALLDAPKADLGAVEGSDLVLRVEEGTLAAAGGLIDMYGLRPIEIRGLEGLRLRGTAFVASDSSFKQVQFGAGLQTRPLHIPGLDGREIANWIILGVNAQRRDSTDAAADSTFAAATYRMFVGKAFGWRSPPRLSMETLAARIGDAYVRDVPTMAGARVKKAQFEADEKASPEQIQFARAVSAAELIVRNKARESPGVKFTEADDDRTWAAAARGYALGRIEAISLRPTFAVYAELSGWYEFRGGDSRRQRNLFTVSTDYYFMPGRDDMFLRLRYENGHERGAPDERKNQLLASIALRL